MKTFTHKLVLALTAALLTTAAALAQRVLPGGVARQTQAVSAQQCRATATTKNVYMQDPNKPEKQPSKWLTNLPIDSTILVQNFNPVVEGTDIAYSTYYSEDLTRYFMGNTIKTIRTIVPAGAKSVRVWVNNPDVEGDTLYAKTFEGYKGDVVEDFPVECPLEEGVKTLEVGFTLHFDEQAPLHAYVVPCNRYSSFVVRDTGTGDFLARDYTHMRYMLYGDYHLCYGYFIQCITEGDGGFKPYDLQMAGVSHVRGFLGDDTDLSIGIMNYGTEPMPNAKLTCTIENTTTDITYNNPVGFLYYAHMDTEVKAPTTPKRIPIVINLVEVNNAPLTEPCAPVEGSVTAVDRQASVPRNVVMEEFTGTWCGWCPRGMRAVELLSEIYGDRFIPIGVHYNDVFESADFKYILDNYASRGFPGCTLNRLTSSDPYNGTGEHGKGDLGIAYDMDYIFELPCEARFDITHVSTDRDTRTVSVTTDATFSIDCIEAPYAVSYVVTESGLKGVQSNYYPTMNPSQVPENLRDLTQKGMQYLANIDHVGRSIEGLLGVEGSIQAPIVKGQKQTFTHTFTLPETVENLANVHIAVLLLDTKTGEILNAQQTGLNLEVDEGISTTTAHAGMLVRAQRGALSVNAPQGATLRIYDAGGRLLRQQMCNGSLTLPLPAGCYVVESSSAAGVQTAKVVL